MSSFTDELVVCFLDDGKWSLEKEFDYHIGVKESDKIIHCPVGMITDFASIPRLFWNIMPPTGEYGKAAVIHDYLYQKQGNVCQVWQGQAFSRKECDEILLEAMGVLCVNWLTRRLIYSAVRTFGWAAWNGHKKRKE